MGVWRDDPGDEGHGGTATEADQTQITREVTEISVCSAEFGEGAEVVMDHPCLVCLLHVVNTWDLTEAQALPPEGTQSLCSDPFSP